MIYLDRLRPHSRPFRHWIADDFIDARLVSRINVEWPDAGSEGWRVEGASWARKGSMLFPQLLPPMAHTLAWTVFQPPALGHLSALLGFEVLPDPWFMEGPQTPRLGGGLHEIPPGGKLNVHVDFEAHPSGLRRVANLLIYLNENWLDEWGGALELHDNRGAVKSIAPRGGRAVLFATTPDSWHGHPQPLACPPDRSRRSLALYFYARSEGGEQRPKTVYRSKG